MDADGASLRHWLARRAPQWRALAERARTVRDRRAASIEELDALVEGYRSLGRDLSLARTLVPESALARDLEALLATCHEILYRPPARLRSELVELVRDEVPAIVRELAPSLALVFALLAGGALVGWLLVTLEPELVSLVASETMIEHVQSGSLWTDDLVNVVPSSLLSASIMANNVTVSLTAFVLGALYGIGTAYVITLNGLMLGGVFAFTYQHHLAGRLASFAIAHGVVELSVICLAGAAGMRLGEALIRPGPLPRLLAFQRAVARAGRLLPVIAVFLVGAGVIEGYVSSDPAFPLASRATIGIGYGALLWAVLTGRASRRPAPAHTERRARSSA